MKPSLPTVACLAVLLAGCGGSTIRQHAAEQNVADFVHSHTGFKPTDVKCPADVPAKVGNTFTCRFTGPDGHYGAQVRITSVHGEEAVFYIVTQRSGS